MPNNPTKNDRSVFLYMDPATPEADEQCGTCYAWIRGDRCFLHGPRIKVTKGMSCCYYLFGDPLPRGTQALILTTPDESCLVDRQVRCENCRHITGGDKCGFFETLNKKLPDLFDLNTSIDPRGCCNAQEPQTESVARSKRLAEAKL